MAPGPAATQRFQAMYPYPGVWSAISTLDMLSAAPPTAAHTGLDGEALRRLPLTVDLDAEFIGCYGSHGPSAPFGPASFGRTSLAMARLMISHAHGTAIYGRDPALKGEEEEEDEEDDELVRFDQEASTAFKALKLAAAAAADAAVAVYSRKGGVSAATGSGRAAKGKRTDIAEEQHEQNRSDAEGGGEYDYYAEVHFYSTCAGCTTFIFAMQTHSGKLPYLWVSTLGSPTEAASLAAEAPLAAARLMRSVERRQRRCGWCQREFGVAQAQYLPGQ